MVIPESTDAGMTGDEGGDGCTLRAGVGIETSAWPRNGSAVAFFSVDSTSLAFRKKSW